MRLDGPVNVASDTHAHISRRRGGSAANVAARAAALGNRSRFLGQVGTDAIGTALLAELADDGVDISVVRRNGSTGTIVALVDHLGERSMLTDRRACVDLSEPDPYVARRRRRTPRPLLFVGHRPDRGDRNHGDRMGARTRDSGVDRRVVDGDHRRGRHRRGAQATRGGGADRRVRERRRGCGARHRCTGGRSADRRSSGDLVRHCCAAPTARWSRSTASPCLASTTPRAPAMRSPPASSPRQIGAATRAPRASQDTARRPACCAVAADPIRNRAGR